MAKQYWLMKSEPDVYSIDDLRADGTCFWEGVRNYQARNLLRDQIKKGDGVLFYHSNARPPGVAGVAKVVRPGYPDHTAFDPESPYYDPKSDPESPRWFMVDVAFVEAFAEIIPLSVLQATPELDDMMVTKKGMRLSVQPVSPQEWKIVLALGRKAGKGRAAPPPRSGDRPPRRAARRREEP